jgi:large subunit ribosomal protein L21
MKFAIVESGGKQYRAVEGGTLEVDRLPVETGANIKLEQVLLLADGETISVGTPLVKDTPVWTTVIEHFKGPKVFTFNYRPKKRERVKIGHRQNYTRLMVEQIGGATWVKKEPVKVEKAVEVKTEKAEKEEKASRTAPKAAPKATETKATTAKAAPKAKAEGKTSPKVTTTTPKKPAAKATTKAAPKASSRPTKEKKPAASSRKTSSAKAESKKKTPAASPKGKKPAVK